MKIFKICFSISILLSDFGYDARLDIVSNRIDKNNILVGEPSIPQDPELDLNVSQIIRHYGYPCEDYETTTKDGFILSLQRIPRGRKKEQKDNEAPCKPRPVVFIQHGLLCSSTIWVINMVEKSLGFILADAGYDVWLGNSRGNTYSHRHVKYTPDQPQYWDWSWDHMAQYDVPTSLSYILNVTNQTSLNYIGHSQGTLIAFSALSDSANARFHKTYPSFELRKSLKSIIALSPVAFLGHLYGPMKTIADLPVSQEIIMLLLGKDKAFLPHSHLLKLLDEIFCDRRPFEAMCSNILFLLCGPDFSNLNISRIPVYYAHYPAGTSVLNMVHFIQGIRSGKYQKFDYGTFANEIIYKQPTPPQYNLSHVGDIPTFLFTGSNDWIARAPDVELMEKQLKSFQIYNIPSYNHLDFIWGEDAYLKIYPTIVDILNKINVK